MSTWRARLFQPANVRSRRESCGVTVVVIMESSLLRDTGRGAMAGAAGATFQVAVGWLLARLLLPADEDNNIAPRLVNRTFATLGQPADSERAWLLGSMFHFGYGAGWGIALARGRALARLPAVLIALPISMLIYVMAFSRVGAGTILRAEERPSRRHTGKQASLLGVVMAYSLSTGLFVDLLGRRDVGVHAGRMRQRAWQEAAGPDYWL